MRSCPFCNMDLPDQARFCTGCGNIVALPSTPPPPPVVGDPLLPMAIREASKILDGAAWGRKQPQKESEIEENALPTEPASNPAHGEHHQPLLPYGDHRQSLPTHREHHQVQPIYGPHQQTPPIYGPHQQTQPIYGPHQQAQPIHGPHQQTQPLRGPHQQAQPIRGAHQPGRNILSSRLRLRQTKIFFLVGIILLVLGGGAGLYALDEASEQNGVTVGFLTFDESLEHQIHEGLTHNQAHAIATESAMVTTATAAAQQHPFPQNGTLALDDPLTHDTERYQWRKGYWSDSGTSCTFKNDGYHIVEKNANRFYYCISSSTNFSDFAFQVQMTFVSGKFGGIIFRSQGKQHYYFSIGLNQTYNLQMFVDDTGATSRNLARGSTTAIDSNPRQTNLLAVVARGNNIDLYVNNQYITSVQDSSYSNGQIGLVAQDETEPAEVIFSNAKVWAF